MHVLNTLINKPILLLISLIVVAGCATFAAKTIDFPDNTLRDRSIGAERAAVEYHRDVEPILKHRCLVCHGCYDAPCQLKMETMPGIERGAHKDPVYAGTRLRQAQLTRLGIDEQTTEGWRRRGFYPILNEGENIGPQNLEQSLFYNLVAQKRKYPSPASGPLPASFTFDLNRSQSCPTPTDYATYEKEKPLWGMPYGLPALSDLEHSTLTAWLLDGSPVQPRPALDAQHQQRIKAWEIFLNGDSLKQQLMSRYIYEHLFLAHLFFDNPGSDSSQEIFRLVRSRSAPGQPIDEIATRRPFDDPGVARVYYRLKRLDDLLTLKAHMPYALNGKRMKNWRNLFVKPEYVVESLPGYKPANASNPFIIFADIPVRSRYRFMLEESKFTLMGFIKGPVCRGQVALNVIEDHFWVAYANPDREDQDLTSSFLADALKKLQLPASAGSDSLTIRNWLTYSKREKEWLQARAKAFREHRQDNYRISLDSIWDGDGDNENATSTVFRHFDTATVVRGFVGQPPKTAWVVDYPLLERIHYLLVAGYDVYGNVEHQLFTRLYMDFLRLEGEFNFLFYLPPQVRERELDLWYRGAHRTIEKFVEDFEDILGEDNGLVFESDNPKLEFFQRLRNHIGPAMAPDRSIAGTRLSSVTKETLKTLHGMSGANLRHLPQMALLEISNTTGTHLLTLIHNVGHKNVASAFGESSRLVPEEDNLTVVDGILGAYPNMIFQVNESDFAVFAERIATLTSDADYTVLVADFGLRRTDPSFWEVSDRIMLTAQSGEERGVLDYGRYQNQ
jgi:hypothetical protein